jgi:hypothetical protein
VPVTACPRHAFPLLKTEPHAPPDRSALYFRPAHGRDKFRPCGPAAVPAAALPAQQQLRAGDAAGNGVNVGAGNPINVINGNKYQREVDMAPLPGTLGLEIIRHYNSAFSRPGASTNLIGRGWKLSYETELANLVRVDMPTGSRYYHYEDGHFPTLLTGISELATDPHGRLAWQRVSTYGYDADGRPTCRCAGCPPRQE